MAKRTLDDFFTSLTDDGSKADVMKAKIAADAEVAKAEASSETLQLRRVVPWIAVVLVALFSSCTSMCVADKWQDVQTAKIKAEHPDSERIATDRANAEATLKNAQTCHDYPQRCTVTITQPTVQAAAPPASAAPAPSGK